RDVIDRLLVESAKLNHGGTIVWLPEEELSASSSWILPKYVVHNGPEGASLLDHLCALDQKREDRLSRMEGEGNETVPQSRAVEEGILECKRHIVEHVELLANLTSVDGALILTDKLQPLSFSSILIAPLWYGETIYGPNDEAHNMGQVNLTRYGTRHNSAVNFVGYCPGSVTFVISQDGPIAGLTRKDEETVYWWPDCLSRLWAS
ncbi:MAG: hypothetical protein G8345_17230, partial [Magnetococcales bacterium]|nr:hypothetical protein [Magnetococcales bacterium]